MKKVLIVAAALSMLAAPAFAQTAVSGSGSISSSGVNFAPQYNTRANRYNPAPAAFGAAAQTPYSCKQVGGLSTPWGGVALPMSDDECGPIVAGLAWDSCKTDMCRTTMTQNRYIARSLEATQAAYQAQARAVVARSANVGVTSRPDYCNPRSRNYAPSMCTGN